MRAKWGWAQRFNRFIYGVLVVVVLLVILGAIFGNVDGSTRTVTVTSRALTTSSSQSTVTVLQIHGHKRTITTTHQVTRIVPAPSRG